MIDNSQTAPQKMIFDINILSRRMNDKLKYFEFNFGDCRTPAAILFFKSNYDVDDLAKMF
jgi:hypothetical protein